MVSASRAAASAGRATGVPLMATTKFESSRSDAGRRRIVQATKPPDSRANEVNDVCL